MKEIKLSGREQAVLRAIGYGSGSTGAEIQSHTGIDKEDVVDILNGLFDVGYVEILPTAERVTWSAFDEAHFEINPAYALQLKEALRRN
jgi:helix-turn-helix protein